MSVVKNNLITKGLSGMLGGMLVFRKVGDRTIVSTAPEGDRPATEAQKAQRQRFQQAVIYAKAQMADANTKAAYHAARKEEQTAYTVAVADFFHAPDIVEVDLTQYKGRVGDTIRVKVTDDFKVADVQIDIHDADGILVESGAAVQQPNNLDWLFRANAVNASLEGDKITIRAHDLPGNTTVEQLQM